MLATTAAAAPPSAIRLVAARRFASTAAPAARLRTTPPPPSSAPFSTTTTTYRSSTFARTPLARSTLLAAPAPWHRHTTSPTTTHSTSARYLSLFASSNKAAPADPPLHPAADTNNHAAANATHASDHVAKSAESLPAEVAEDLTSAAHNAFPHPSEAASASASASTASTTSTGTLASDVASAVDGTAASTLTESLASTGFAGVHAGQLSELGLAHWTSPVGWVTQLLDLVGTHTGLPWWGTIVVTTVALRLVLAPINIAGQKNAIRLGNISPRMKELMDDVKHYKAAGDQRGMQESVMAVQKLMRDNNTNPFKSFTPILFQFPLMFSFFLALERIAKSGAAGFDIGGPFWTTDLTSPDPTYVLPLVSTVATLAVAELGFKLGTTGGSAQDPGQTKMIKYIFRGAMPLIGWFATGFPSGVLVYWATTNVWSLLQMLVLQIPFVRVLARFPKRVQHAPSPYAKTEEGFMQRIKRQMAESQSQNARPVASPSSSINATATGGKQERRMEAFKELLKKSTGGDVLVEEQRGGAQASSGSEAASSSSVEAKRRRVAKARAARFSK